MAIGTTTPRDQLDRLLAFLRRSMRYWWLVGIITFVGGALVAALALRAKPKYLSEAKLFYNERISSSLLQGRDVIQQTRNLGDRYRELLLARPQLTKIITELQLLPEVVDGDGMEVAIEELRQLIQFRVRGTNMFHIQFTYENPEAAQAAVAMMTELLSAEDRRLRRDNASDTKNFLLEEKAKVNEELTKRTKELNKFLAEHPEFAMDATQGAQAATGAGIRAAAQGKTTEPIDREIAADPRLFALERQRRRLKDRLEAPDPSAERPRKSPEQIEAENLVREAKNELEAAQRDLENKLSVLQPAHPDVVRAKSRVSNAEKRHQQALAAVPPDLPSAGPIDRRALQEELLNVERQIAATRAKIRQENPGQAPQEEQPEQAQEEENWVVELETEFVRLNQAVGEARRRVDRLDASLSEAELTASQQMAEEGAVLSILDPANLPTKPQGKSPLILIAVGIMAFMVIGAVLALALALVDDRIYTAGDLDHLGIAPVMVAIPKRRQLKRTTKRVNVRGR